MQPNEEEKDPRVADVKQEEVKGQPKMREILILTDGNTATIKSAQVAGSLELKAILVGLANNIK